MALVGDRLSRPRFLRWLGFLGSVCCAADGFLFGAATYIRSNVSVVTILRGPHGILILLLWALGLAALCTAWWSGRRLAETADLGIRWIVVTAALWIVPMLVIPPLGSRDMYAYACQGALFNAGLNPYAVGVSAQPCPWLDSVSVVWRDTPTPYGPLFIMLAGAAAMFGSQLAAIVVFRLVAVLGIVGIAAGLPVLARRVGVPEQRALWLVLCCPLVSLHLIGGGHNDALTVAFLIAGLAVLAARPRRLGLLILAGVLLGLSIAVKITLGVVLPFAALLAVGGLQPGGWPQLVRRGGTVLFAALGTLVALSFLSGLGLGWATALSGAGESVYWTSPPTAIGIAVDAVERGLGADLDVVPAVRAVALVLLPVVLLVIWWRSRRRDPLIGAGLALLALIFLAPITQPWYLMWPLAMLAVTPARVRWLAVTIVLWVATILPDGSSALRPLKGPMAFAMVVLVGWVAVRSVRWLRGDEVATYSEPPRQLAEVR